MVEQLIFGDTADYFAPGQPILVARAPGRLDVMGGIADYSGATVAEWPLAEGTFVAVQASADDEIVVRSAGPALASSSKLGTMVEARISRYIFGTDPAVGTPERLRAELVAHSFEWAAYALGPLAILVAEGIVDVSGGLRIFVWSDVPLGAGVSSSAALEVAAMRAITALYHIELEPLRLALLAQQAEQRVAAAPCGIMDQATATLGRTDHLFLLKCQPAEVIGYHALPRDVHVAGISSGVAHSVAGNQYGRVRAATFMGWAIIAAHDPTQPPDGYLCNIPVDVFKARYTDLLPPTMSGEDFLTRYGQTGDTATQIEPQVIYAVRACTTHPVREQAHVTDFLAALDRYAEAGNSAALIEAGTAMYRSHDSYGRRCGLGSPQTDLIVEMIREAGPRSGLYGAKITGGGSGGTVAVLGTGQGFSAAIEQIAQEYQSQSGQSARVLTGSSAGAMDWPVRRLAIDSKGEPHDL